MSRVWFRRRSAGFGVTPCSWEGWILTILAMLLVAAVVLVGPGIRDNLLRPLFVVLGLALVLLPYGLIARARSSAS